MKRIHPGPVMLIGTSCQMSADAIREAIARDPSIDSGMLLREAESWERTADQLFELVDLTNPGLRTRGMGRVRNEKGLI